MLRIKKHFFCLRNQGYYQLCRLPQEVLSLAIGTAWQALENGAKVFYVCNNPLDVLHRHVARSREIIDEPRITKLDLSTGPMAVAGSTRMQATTMEILAVGSAIEFAIKPFISTCQTPKPCEYTTNFSQLLGELGSRETISTLAEFVALEESVYRERGAVTYFADRAMLDIFTDTTERAPTFMLPPFRKCDDTASPRSWAFVKNPAVDTERAWAEVFQRCPRCLAWTPEDYRELGAATSIVQAPPGLSVGELCKFRIGNEDDHSRYESPQDLALLLLVGDESKALADPDGEFMNSFGRGSARFGRRAVLTVGGCPVGGEEWQRSLHVPCSLPNSPLRLWEHLALKLVLNTVSTATMARLGRVTGNWMACVETTNKKLIDRGTRLIAELSGLSYPQACRELFASLKQLESWSPERGERPSPVAYTIERLSAKV